MKMAFSFISGIIVCGLLFFGASAVIPTLAETDNTTELSDNLSQGLADLLPDIEKIYQESLTMPFIKAEEKIYDEDIADFYHELLGSTGLREPDGGSE